MSAEDLVAHLWPPKTAVKPPETEWQPRKPKLIGNRIMDITLLDKINCSFLLYRAPR